ncbi:MAG: UDP-glucose 4-epimerase, partial [Planctomycetes bacterium]|nr:UDP-glucose 4-epimerase [Planctomycetota bacterium]
MILIVGGAGYIGSHTNKLLTEKGHQTVVYDSLVTGHRDSVHWGHFIHADLADTQKLKQCFQDHPIEAVMHFSAFSLVPESVEKPDLYYRNNVVNTLNLLNTMREFDVPYFIFSSTCAIYGNPKTIPIDEHHPQNPITPYGRTKRMIEEILCDYDTAFGIKHINLRYFNAAGADPDGLI